ncbi:MULTISPECIES: ABC transporter ATP-binding protein [Nocardiopsis]|uniref:Heme ABC transporter ATP-binding protein n=1 Tax=Nocardiopsis sinuspersici TaxID=501010 RepID=A0A1V3C1X6_9ACTN|nr:MULTISPECIES: ABC transporter ATP-binding protein [Nocardiopsis]NYH50996.1 simple sugar transport system ATP-binding protein [Nocardiopsis sinuspersici]OOC54801.1 heme ABC transporter ATP-binding protein [Nocardiopsis sinuspersici]
MSSTPSGDGALAPPAVELRGITKRFPGVVANHDIDITVAPGTVHAIVGENGAGKSTLMKTLYGMHRPDEGHIHVRGREVRFHSPSDAIRSGIGMVHQHFMLADNLTVLENVVLGAERRFGIGNRARTRIRTLSDQYGLGVDPDRLTADLGVGERQRVEILKVLYRGAQTIILDEPTAVLVPQEVDELFDNLRELKREGLTVIFISHKLDEVLSVADEITVIRRGTTVATADPGTTTAQDLATLMVGGELPVPELRESTVTDHVVLSLDGVTVQSPDGRAVVDGVSVDIHRGEIVGIAGVEGNGQSELIEAIMGMRPLASGRVFLEEHDVTGWSTLRIREAGVGYIPEDRHRHGMLLESPLWENRILGHQTKEPSVRGPWINRTGARTDSERIVAEYDVRTPNIDVVADALSGGNQQKFIIGREMSGSPRFLVAAHPTRGVDVGAQAAIWEQLRDARAAGLAVLLVSADLDELIGMSDTLHVILRGRLVAQADPTTVTPEQLGSAMTGAGLGGADESTEGEGGTHE